MPRHGSICRQLHGEHTLIPSLPVTAAPVAQDLLARILRTEDVRFSPDGHCLVVAGFARSSLVVLQTRILQDGAALSVVLDGGYELHCAGLDEPHGLDFLDSRTLAVANRGAALTVLRLPDVPPWDGVARVCPLAQVRGNWRHPVKNPGSVVTVDAGPGRKAALVCNNYIHTVTRHVIGLLEPSRALSHGTLLRKGLNLPDGITISADGRWLAVSNHNTNSVLLFANDAALGPRSGPVGELQNVNYPHGLRFTADGRRLLVADAGLPYVHAYAAPDGEWRGVRQPVATLRIMDEVTYLRGRYNQREGGPKGLDIDPGQRVVVVTSEHQPLAFFALEALGANPP